MADKAGHFNVMIVMSAFITALIVGLWLFATVNAAIINFAALLGVGSGAGISLTPALCAKTSHLSQRYARVPVRRTLS